MRNILDDRRGVAQIGIAGIVIIVAIIYFVMSSQSQPASIVSDNSALTGDLLVTLSDGYVNVTTTSDYLNDAKDIMKIYVTDADIADGEIIRFNATIQRMQISEDANIKVTCSIPDKEIAGITQKNLAQKTGGQVDLSFIGGSSTGTFENDNTAYTNVAFAEGTGSKTIEIRFEQDETYQDGMTAYDDVSEVNCNADGTPFNLQVLAVD